MPTISSLPSLSTTTNLNNVVFPVVETVGNVSVTKNATLGQVISAAVSSSPVKSVAGQTGNVTLSYRNITGTPPVATKSVVGAVSVGSGIGVSAAGVISLAAATTTASGGVVIGSGLKVDSSGTVSLATATTATLGGVIIGSGLSITTSGVLSSVATMGYVGSIGALGYAGSRGYNGSGGLGYTGSAGAAGLPGSTVLITGITSVTAGTGLTAVTSLTVVTLSVPVASTTTFGSVKIGSGLTVTSGTISVTGGAGGVGYTGSAGSGGTGSNTTIVAGTGISVVSSGSTVTISVPVASTTTFGSVKIGSGLTVTSGTISVTGGAGGVGYTGSAGSGGTGSGYTGSQGVAGTTGYVGSAGSGSTFTGGTVANPTTFSTTASFNSTVNFSSAVTAVGIIGSTINNFTILGGLTVANAFGTTQGASTNSTTGALVVTGGVGISGNVNIGGNLTVNGQSLSSNGSNSANAVFTGTVTAASFVSTTTGTPTLYGASNLNLAAVGRVQVSQSPLRLWSITSATRATLAPGNGDLIYNSDVNKFQGYANSAWVDITGASGSGNGYTGSASTAAGYNGSLGYTGSAGAGYTGSASTVVGYNGSLGYTGSTGAGYTGSASTVIGYTGSSGTYTQGSTGTVTRTITAKLQESVSVLDFGADPTGVADCTTAFKNAFAVWPSSGTLLIPAGTYMFTGTVTTPSLPTNGLIKGAGNSSSILKFTGAGNGLVLSASQSIEDVQIQAANASNNIGLQISGLNQTVKRVQIQNGSGAWLIGIQCSGTVTTLIEGCYTGATVNYGIQAINNGATAVTGLTLVSNEIRANSVGLNITTNGYSNNVGASSVCIYGGSIEVTNTTGLLIDYLTTSVAHTVMVYGTQFQQNFIDDIKMTSHGMLSLYNTRHVAASGGANYAVNCSGVQTNSVVRLNGISVDNAGVNTSAVTIGANVANASIIGCSISGSKLTLSAPSKVMLLDNYFFDGTYKGNVLKDDGSGNVKLTLQGATYSSVSQLSNSTGAFSFFNNGVQSYQIDSVGRLNMYNKLYPAKDTATTQSVTGLYAGSGAPSNTNGNIGDFYLRGDTPSTAGQRIYVKNSSTWVGIDSGGAAVSVAEYGAVGDGTTDDTAAIQAALNAVSAAGGGRVIIPNNFRCLIDSANLIIPNRVNLAGPHQRPGQCLPFTDATITATTGAIILNPLYTINLAPGVAGSTGISGLYIFAKGLTLPTSDADAIAKVAAWTGTAITLGSIVPIKDLNTGHDSYVGHCHILGFNQAIHGDWCARYAIEYITGDCQNGIYMAHIYDMGRIHDCHFWDFFTYGRPATNWRSGTAYYFDVGADWVTVENCFTFGHYTGFRIDGAIEVKLIGCSSDGNSSNKPAGSKSFYITNTATTLALNTNLVCCQASSHDTGYYIDATDWTSLVMCTAFSTSSNHVFMDKGSVKILSSHFYNPTQNASIVTGSTLKWAHLSDNSFDTVGNVYSLNTATQYNVEILQSNNYFNSLGIDASTAKIVTGAECGESRYSIGGANGYQLRFYHSTGTTTSPRVVNSGEQLGTLCFYGYNGNSFYSDTQLYPHLSLRAHVDGPVNGAYVPTGWIVSTSPNNGLIADRNVTDSAGDFRPLANNAYNLGRAGDSAWKNIYSTNGTIQVSDERTKTEITTATLGLDFINALHPVSYKFKEGSTVVTGQIYRDADGNECSADATGARPAEIISHTVPGARTHWGLIAQEVKQAVDAAGVDFGGWILTDINDPDSQQALRYEQFIAPLIKAVQELTAQVKDLQSKIK